MKKYFIIRAQDWYICTVCGTMQQLKDFLASIGSKIVDTQEIYYGDMHLIYRQRIDTETDVIGFDRNLYEQLEKEISDKLSALNARAYSFHKDEIEQALHDVCGEMPIKSDRIDVLVSDGEEYELPSNHFCGRRDFCKFSDIDIKTFALRVREFAYIDLTILSK